MKKDILNFWLTQERAESEMRERVVKARQHREKRVVFGKVAKNKPAKARQAA